MFPFFNRIKKRVCGGEDEVVVDAKAGVLAEDLANVIGKRFSKKKQLSQFRQLQKEGKKLSAKARSDAN